MRGVGTAKRGRGRGRGRVARDVAKKGIVCEEDEGDKC